MAAHRVAFMLGNGLSFSELRDVEVIMHSCDTPGCCNPAHLRAGTQLENMRDMIRKGRRSPNASNRILSEAAVVDIRTSGARTADLAAKYGVAITTVKSAKSRQSHKGIP